MIKTFVAVLASTVALTMASATWAEKYAIDTKGAHAFIQFKIVHLGFSWLLGRFNTFEGNFDYSEDDPASAKVEVNINVASLDSNHAERDKHLRSKDFFDVKNFPTAKFVSTSFKPLGGKKAVLTGNLTLRGITKSVTIDVVQMGAGKDPWGGYRRGFEGRTTIALKDYGIKYDLGPAGRKAELLLSLEGIRQETDKRK